MVQQEFIHTFNPANASGKSTLVICNYKWYRPYFWHIPQLNPELYDGPITVINLAKYERINFPFLGTIHKMYTVLSLSFRSDRLVFDGFVSKFLYLLIATGVLNHKHIILSQQNYIALRLQARSIAKYAFLLLVFRNVDRILCNVESQKMLFQSYFGDHIATKCGVYVPPINFEAKEDFLAPSDILGNHILSAGQANRNYDLLASAAQKYSRPTTIYCPEALFKKFNFPTCVTYHPEQDTSRLLQLITDCRLLVIPLTDSFEMSGLRVLTFGLELGKTIIVTQTQGLKEVFGDNPPFLYVSKDDPMALSNLIEDIWDDVERLRYIGHSARVWAENNLLSADFIDTIWRDEISSR